MSEPGAVELVRAQLRAILERWDVADRRLSAAEASDDQAELAAAREAVAGELSGFQFDLANLFGLLWWVAEKMDRDTLRRRVLALVRPELDQLAEGIAIAKRRR